MKFLNVLLLISLSACNAASPQPDLTTQHIAKNTVMITNMARNSGGSGTIIEHGSVGSVILTNSHVCEVAKDGGFVITVDGIAHPVSHYTPSKTHDLCLIVVMEDLGSAAKIADHPPVFQARAVISGHPRLQPLTLSEGRFSSKQPITIVTGVRRCEPSDYENPDTGMFCDLMGVVPVIKQYHSMFVTALIQPGSSGSGIYNNDGEIEAVVFAGSQGLGWAWSVPYEFVQYFLKYELSALRTYKPGEQKVEAVRAPAGYLDKIAKLCEKVSSKICQDVSKAKNNPKE